MSDETILVLGTLQIPVGAGRGITQSLTPIDNGNLRRTVNGELIDTTRAINRKFSSTIRCTDMSAPTLAEIWKGSELVVSCISKIRQKVSPPDDTVTLIRLPVPSTIAGYNADDERVDAEVSSVDDNVVTFDEEVVRVEFHPILTMLVVDKSEDEDEYAASTGWSLDLEEV